MLGGTLKILAAQALFPLTGLITAGVLTRALGVDGYGHFTLAASLVAWLELSITLLLGNATVHWVATAAERGASIRALLRLHLVVSVGVAALFWLLAPSVALLWNEPAMTPTLRLFALDIPIFCLARAYGSVLAGQQSFSQQALAIASRWTARLVLTVALLLAGFSIPGAVCAALGASVIELLVASRRVARPALLRSPTPLPGLWSFAGPIFVSAIAIRTLHLDLLLLKALGASVTDAGYYGAAHNLALAPILIATAVSSTVLSSLTGALRDGEREQAKRIAGVVLRILIASIPCAALLAGSAESVVTLVYGAALAPAAPLFAILIFSSAGLVSVNIALAAIIATGDPRRTLWPVLPVVLPALVAYLVLIPEHGLPAAATVTTAAALLAALLCGSVMLYHWRLSVPVLTVLRSGALALGLFAVSGAWVTPGPWALAKVLLLFAALPLGFVMLGELSRRDREDLHALVRRLAPRDATG